MTDSWRVQFTFANEETITIFGGGGMPAAEIRYSGKFPTRGMMMPPLAISDASDAVALFKKYRGMVEDEMWAADEVYRMFVYGGKR
jgi:hypothetical protein